MFRGAFLVLSLLALANALYGPKSDVVQVGADNFKEEVMKFGGVAIVEFYAPWCGHCKQLAPEYEKAASILKGVVKVVAVDATQHESLAQKYQIQGFPTLKIFGADKRSPIDYSGQRTADAIVSETMKAANQLVKDRKGGKSGSSKSESKSESKPKSKGGSKSDVVQLTEANFNALVMESNDHWLVEFYAPWCGHCKALAPEWEEAATTLKSSGVKLGAVDATVETSLAQKYGVKGYPTIKVFNAGPKGKPVDYPGQRKANDIVEYALSSQEKAGASIPVEIHQLVNQESFADSCGNKKLCAILFVPHILDSGATQRNQYIELLGDIAKEFRKFPFGLVWSEANAQPKLEEAFHINGNFPTIAVVSTEKKVYAVPKVSFNKKNIQAFLQGLVSGVEKTTALGQDFPTIEKVTKWDGKDGVLATDEIPLDQLFGDDN